MPGYLIGPGGQAYQDKHMRLLFTKDPFRPVCSIHGMTLISASVCLPGLSRQPSTVNMCPASRLHSYVGRCHTLPSAPDYHTNLYFCTILELHQQIIICQRMKIRLTSVDAWLNTLFDMSVLIRTWRTALPAFTLHRKVTAIQAIGLTALI